MELTQITIIVTAIIFLAVVAHHFWTLPKDSDQPKQSAQETHHFIEVENECCSPFQKKRVDSYKTLDNLTLDFASSDGLFKDLSIGGPSSWINHYQCSKCNLVWELSPPSHGVPGYFKPLQPPQS